jgi:hypothetical protein
MTWAEAFAYNFVTRIVRLNGEVWWCFVDWHMGRSWPLARTGLRNEREPSALSMYEHGENA